ncbi:TOR complex subunit lst8 [Tilletia horrida]|nr:TOR complex subunit lst8 [Tilletia horrida]
MHHPSARQPAPPAGMMPPAALAGGGGGSGAGAHGAFGPAGTVPSIIPAPPPSEPVLLVTAGYDHTIRFWQAWQSECVRTIHHAEGQVNRLAISPDRRLLAVAANQAVRIYDCTVNPSAANMAGLGIGAGGTAGGAGAGQGGSGGSGSGQPGGNNPIATFTGHTGNVTNVCWQQDRKWLASSSEDGTVKVWDLRAGRAYRTYAHEDPVNDVIVHPNQGELICCDEGGKMKIWDLAEDRCVYSALPEPGSALRSVTAASDASCLVAGGNSGRVYVWKIGRDRTEEAPAAPPAQAAPAGQQDHRTEAQRDPNTDSSGRTNGPSSSASRAPGDPVAAPTNVGDDPTAATAAGFAADQPTLLPPTSSVQQQGQNAVPPIQPAQDAPFTYYDDLIPMKHWTAHSKYLIRALLSPNVRYLATCGADTTIKIWNMENYEGALEKTLLGHQRWVWDLAFSADSGFLVSASSDHVGRLWDISTGETVRTYTGHDKAIVTVALNDQARSSTMF